MPCPTTQRVSLASLGISNWLGFRLQLMAAALAAAVSGAAVMEHQGLLPWARSSAAAGELAACPLRAGQLPGSCARGSCGCP